jgi:hypothetical protein
VPNNPSAVSPDVLPAPGNDTQLPSAVSPNVPNNPTTNDTLPNSQSPMANEPSTALDSSAPLANTADGQAPLPPQTGNTSGTTSKTAAAGGFAILIALLAGLTGATAYGLRRR